MANLKISELPAASALVGSEVLPIVQSGQTVKTTVQDIVDLSAPVVMATYQDFYNLLIAEALVPGTKYEVPYRSVNWLNGYNLAVSNPTPIDPSFNPRQIHTGPEEVLIVEATSTYEVSTTSYSKKYMMDILDYNPYTNKIGLPITISNGSTLPNSTVVSGFDLQWDGTNVYFNMPAGYPAYYGQLLYIYADFGTYSQDGAHEPLLPNTYPQFSFTSDVTYYAYPKALSRVKLFNNGYKVVLLDLTEADYNNYEVNSLYIQHIVAVGDAYGWVLRRQSTDTHVNVPFDFRSVTYRRYEIDTSLVLPVELAQGFKYMGIGDNWKGAGTTGNYVDMLSIPQSYSDNYNITISGLGGPTAYSWYAGSCENNVFFDRTRFINLSTTYMYNNTFLREVTDINLSSMYFNGNTITTGFKLTSGILTLFTDNIISILQLCTFNSVAFQYNKLGNIITNNMSAYIFSNNTLYSFSDNSIFKSCQGINNPAGSMLNNVIHGEINGGLFAALWFQYNYIKNDMISVNLAAATHVYEPYPSDVFKNSAGVLKLSYFNASDVLTVVAPTA